MEIWYWGWWWWLCNGIPVNSHTLGRILTPAGWKLPSHHLNIFKNIRNIFGNFLIILDMIKSPIKCCQSKLKIKISNSIDCLMEKVTEESDGYTIVICPVDKLIIKKNFDTEQCSHHCKIRTLKTMLPYEQVENMTDH